MAIVKIKFAKHVETLVRYVMETKGPDDPVSTHNCDPERIISDFKGIKSFEHGNGSVNVIHVVQSWNVEESKRLTPGEFNDIGRDLISKQFPGHAFAVVTHTDTGKVHNHIVISPWSIETGKKIRNKKHHLYDLRSTSDSLCKERGLSVVNGPALERQARLPESVQKIAKFRGGSWLFDLVQKADFARAYATSYDEYVGILGEMGVKAHVENKNISYFYSEKARGKRGDKIGRLYDKEGLEQSFKENDGKFKSVPGLRDKVRGIVSSKVSGKANSNNTDGRLTEIEDSPYKSGTKDYTKHTKRARPDRIERYAHELDVSHSIIPMVELRKARHGNIISYCRDNKIALEKTETGKHTLKGRPHVEINDYEWVNKKNRTKGSLIELVAAHKDMTFLQAVADINGNKRLLVLEKHFGETKRKFQSFYIPKEGQLNELDAKSKIGSVLFHFGANPDHAATLFKTGQAQVTKEGTVRLFAKDDDSGALEFHQDGNKNWHKTVSGAFHREFFAVSNRGKNARVYVDPFTFMKSHGKGALWPAQHTNVICLMAPDEKIMDQLIAGLRHVQTLEFITNKESGNHQVELD